MNVTRVQTLMQNVQRSASASKFAPNFAASLDSQVWPPSSSFSLRSSPLPRSSRLSTMNLDIDLPSPPARRTTTFVGGSSSFDQAAALERRKASTKIQHASIYEDVKQSKIFQTMSSYNEVRRQTQ
jgi:hypothetical protein